MNDHERDRDTAHVPTLLAGRYRIVSPLGSRGMADVYLAEDERLGRMVAVKVLNALAADDEFLERFRIEAPRRGQPQPSQHRRRVRPRHQRTAPPTSPWSTCPASRSSSGCAATARFPPDEAVTIALAVLSALAAAHARDIVHRDVTSYNVMLDEGGRVVVTDFGIARMGDSALTRTGAMIGTSSYLSRAGAGAPGRQRSDLYSLGVVLYEMLTGASPFRGETDVAVAVQHVSTAPPNPRTLQPAVSEALAGVAMRALGKNAADRYQTADEFAAALRKAQQPARTPDGDGVTAAGAMRECRRRRAADAAGAAGMACSPRVRLRRPSPSRPPPACSRRRHAAPPASPPPCPSRPSWSRTRPPATRRRSRRPRVRPRRRRRRRRIVLAVVLIALAAAAAWFAYAYLSPPARRSPRVVGERRADATKAVRGEGLRPRPALRLGRQVRRGLGRAPGAAGGRVRGGRGEGRPVGERGPLHIPSPDLTGLAAGVARSRLQAESLNSKSRKAASETTPKGQIFKQKPSRRGDRAARRHRRLLGEQRAAEDRTCRTSSASRRAMPRRSWRTPASS